MKMHVLCFGNKHNEEVCHRFILICKSFKFMISLGMFMMNQDLVAKVKNLVALAPALGAISCPAIGQNPLFVFCYLIGRLCVCSYI